MGKQNAAKFIARNRKPRVQIEYETETGGAKAMVELPFVMGVMADLSGDSKEPLPPASDRKFVGIDAENFDARMEKAFKPRVAFKVPNKVNGEGGDIAIDISFEKMEDFSPAAIARKVEPLSKLLDTRTQLSNLLSMMDGRTTAEDLIGRLLKDDDLRKSLLAKIKPVDGANG